VETIPHTVERLHNLFPRQMHAKPANSRKLPAFVQNTGRKIKLLSLEPFL